MVYIHMDRVSVLSVFFCFYFSISGSMGYGLF